MKFYYFIKKNSPYYPTPDVFPELPLRMNRLLRDLSEAPIQIDLVLDYFVCLGWENDEDLWEERLYDIYGVVPFRGGNLFLSSRLKQLLEKLVLIETDRFYPAQFLFRGEKLDYYIFQTYTHLMDQIIYPKSVFCIYDYNTQKKESLKEAFIQTKPQFIEFRFQLSASQSLRYESLLLRHYSDLLFPIEGRFVISEQLKLGMEQLGIDDFLFQEVDIEICFLDPPTFETVGFELG